MPLRVLPASDGDFEPRREREGGNGGRLEMFEPTRVIDRMSLKMHLQQGGGSVSYKELSRSPESSLLYRTYLRVWHTRKVKPHEHEHNKLMNTPNDTVHTHDSLVPLPLASTSKTTEH